MATGDTGAAGTIRRWMRREDGMSEITAAIFVLPFIAFLIFVLVDVGFNLRYRTLVDNITQNTTSALANDGAQYWARTTVLPTGPDGERYDPSTFTWEQYGTDRLQALCGTNRCTDPSKARMVCTVQGGISDGALARDVAPTKNTPVECTSYFPYRPVSPLSNNDATSVGFKGFLTSPIESTVEALTTVGAQG